MPGAYFQSTLRRPIGPGDLGAGLEHEDVVREAAYGYRQRRRQ